ncbi:AraC family transcriptional regulator [Paraburkholderia sp. MM5482-R1]
MRYPFYNKNLVQTAYLHQSRFSHAQHFSTAFKKATGVTPSDFRRAATR